MSEPAEGMTGSGHVMPLIVPDAQRWRSLADAPARSEQAVRFRRELGLATDRPIVMTGHQAELWHPGIMAKYFAGDEFATTHGWGVAWLVVDQDINAPGQIRYPVRHSAAAGGRTLHVETWPALASGTSGDVPTGRCPAVMPSALPTLESGETFGATGVHEGLRAIHAALTRHVGSTSAAEQVGRATAELLSSYLRAPATSIMSLAMNQTSVFADLVEKIRRDPEGCIRSYNVSVAALPNERVQTLREGELPLWKVGQEPGSARRKVRSDEIATLAVERLAPRALLMTGLLRMVGCDLFIHGTGGGGGGRGGGGGGGGVASETHAGYDRITERWLGEWLGAKLAPSVVITATMRLRIAHDGPSADELRRRQWTAHRAMHDPAVMGDSAAADQKRAFVDRIDRVRREGGEATALYKQMHAFLQKVRATHADSLRDLEQAAAGAAERLGDAEIAADRTWAFPLYERSQIAELRAAVGAALAT